MAGVSVRPAVPGDVEAVARLVERLKILNEELDQHFKVVDNLRDVAREYVRATLESDNAFILVAEEDGEVVGFIRVEVVDRLFYKPRLKAVITDLYVSPRARGRRIGALLLEKASEEARKRGARIISAVYPMNNEIARRFYSRMGFKRLQEEVYREI